LWGRTHLSCGWKSRKLLSEISFHDIPDHP
jgi:hypothetical protein